MDIDGRYFRTVISGSLNAPEFTISDRMQVETEESGTTVTISQPHEYANRLLADDAVIRLGVQMTVYMVRYPQIQILYDEKSLDLKAIRRREETIELDSSLDNKHGIPMLRIIDFNLY